MRMFSVDKLIGRPELIIQVICDDDDELYAIGGKISEFLGHKFTQTSPAGLRQILGSTS